MSRGSNRRLGTQKSSFMMNIKQGTVTAISICDLLHSVSSRKDQSFCFCLNNFIALVITHPLPRREGKSLRVRIHSAEQIYDGGLSTYPRSRRLL